MKAYINYIIKSVLLDIIFILGFNKIIYSSIDNNLHFIILFQNQNTLNYIIYFYDYFKNYKQNLINYETEIYNIKILELNKEVIIIRFITRF